jgi:hypothetical protein
MAAVSLLIESSSSAPWIRRHGAKTCLAGIAITALCGLASLASLARLQGQALHVSAVRIIGAALDINFTKIRRLFAYLAHELVTQPVLSSYGVAFTISAGCPSGGSGDLGAE